MNKINTVQVYANNVTIDYNKHMLPALEAVKTYGGDFHIIVGRGKFDLVVDDYLIAALTPALKSMGLEVRKRKWWSR